MKKSFVLLFVLSFAIIAACAPDKESVQDEVHNAKDSLVLALGNEPEEGFDPTVGWGRYGSPLFQSTLFVQDKDFNIVNDLATDYEIKNGGLEWVISIRNDVKFSDGTPLTANDVVFTFETAKNSHSVVDLTNVKRIAKLSDDQVQFILEKPQSTFIYLLTMIGIVPKHAYSENYYEQPIGSGPYQLVQWDKGQQLIVEENPYYYGKKSPFKRLTFLFLSPDAAFSAAKAGEVDIAAIPVHFAGEKVEGMDLIAVDTVDNRGIMLPFVNRKEIDGTIIGNDVTADIAVRKAMNIAVDRELMIKDVLNGFGTPAYSIADGLPWWNPDTAFADGKTFEAEMLLDEAGWTVSENGIREKNGVKASFSLVYPVNDQTRQSLAIAFSQMMEEIGIEVIPEGRSWEEIEEVMYSTPAVMGWGSHDPMEMYYVYHSKFGGKGYHNANFYQNETVDDYLDMALLATDDQTANEYWHKAQWDGETGLSAIGDAPWVWLVNVQHLYYVNNNLDIGEQKIQPHGHGWPITEFIADWRWKEDINKEVGQIDESKINQ